MNTSLSDGSQSQTKSQSSSGPSGRVISLGTAPVTIKEVRVDLGNVGSIASFLPDSSSEDNRHLELKRQQRERS